MACAMFWTWRSIRTFYSKKDLAFDTAGGVFGILFLQHSCDYCHHTFRGLMWYTSIMSTASRLSRLSYAAAC
jgi:hypothetical protein